jgi:WXG100 family type VII secretion target
MASSQIRITPEQLRGSASQCSSYGGECEELINKTQKLIDSLRDQWEGQASEKYAQQFADLRPAFDRMRTLYEELSQQLNGTAQAMENLDQEIAGKLGVQ